MSEQQFTIVGEEYVGYTQGNAYIISNGECKFSLWEIKEDAQKVCDYLNEQQTNIKELQKNFDDIVEWASEIAKRNVVLDEQIGKLQIKLQEKEEEEKLYAQEILRLNELLKQYQSFKDLGGDY